MFYIRKFNEKRKNYNFTIADILISKPLSKKVYDSFDYIRYIHTYEDNYVIPNDIYITILYLRDNELYNLLKYTLYLYDNNIVNNMKIYKEGSITIRNQYKQILKFYNDDYNDYIKSKNI